LFTHPLYLSGIFVLKGKEVFILVKIRVLSKCQHCGGQAYLPVGEEVDAKGNTYMRHRPCPVCQGSGEAGKWVELPELALLLEQVKCRHEHVTTFGSFHLTGGEIWDDIRDICSDCGEVLK
jgi:hypothetical protein